MAELFDELSIKLTSEDGSTAGAEHTERDRTALHTAPEAGSDQITSDASPVPSVSKHPARSDDADDVAGGDLQRAKPLFKFYIKANEASEGAQEAAPLPPTMLRLRLGPGSSDDRKPHSQPDVHEAAPLPVKPKRRRKLPPGPLKKSARRKAADGLAEPGSELAASPATTPADLLTAETTPGASPKARRAAPRAEGDLASPKAAGRKRAFKEKTRLEAAGSLEARPKMKRQTKTNKTGHDAGAEADQPGLVKRKPLRRPSAAPAGTLSPASASKPASPVAQMLAASARKVKLISPDKAPLVEGVQASPRKRSRSTSPAKRPRVGEEGGGPRTGMLAAAGTATIAMSTPSPPPPPHTTRTATPTPVEPSDSDMVNQDLCFACRGPGYFICCETCPKSFHLTCTFPTLKKVPSGTWQCVGCRVARDEVGSDADLEEAKACASRPIDSYKSMWDCIRSAAVCRDTVAFSLPKRMKPKKDLDIPEGLFADEPELERLRKRDESKKPFNGARRGSVSSVRLDIQPPVLGKRFSEIGQCHYCGQRSVIPDLLPQRADPIVPRPLIRCDYCPLLWHLDCLDPPLAVAPSGERRWTCPAHANFPIHPNYIPEVELESGDPFAYDISMRLLPPVPEFRVLLPESSIRLDFGFRTHLLRTAIVPPEDVRLSYAAFSAKELVRPGAAGAHVYDSGLGDGQGHRSGARQCRYRRPLRDAVQIRRAVLGIGGLLAEGCILEGCAPSNAF